jgi:hypothetical protein
MAKKTVGTAEVGSSRCDDRTAQRAVPTKTAKPSALLDTRVIYCGDNLEQLSKLPDVKRMQKDEGRMMKPPRSVILHSSFFIQPCITTGSFYYHCDWHASHYVKVMLDQIFGENNFCNEI